MVAFLDKFKAILSAKVQASLSDEALPGQQQLESTRVMMNEAILINGIVQENTDHIKNKLQEIASGLVPEEKVHAGLLARARELIAV